MSTSLFYATTNIGKIHEVNLYLRKFGIRVRTPQEFGLSLTVDENFPTLEENAKHKVKAYLPFVNNMLVIADDTGLEIDALGGEPGVRPRRWAGYTMSDEKVITYCLERLNGVPYHKRAAQFRTVIALGKTGNKTVEVFDGTLQGIIVEKPSGLPIEGLPFGSLFYVPQWKMMLEDIRKLSQKQRGKFLSHRQNAIANALPRIKQLLSLSA